MPEPLLALLDSNIHDRILADAEAAALIRQAIAAGRLCLLRHACQRRELHRVPDAQRRTRLLALYDDLDGKTASTELDPMLAADDALLLLAVRHGAWLVSDDRALAKRAERAMDYAAFRACLLA
ncbi:hypothetical protein [Ferrovibrio sp.]|uniref:hypothetical protein n=1 Tax=Ferrovibrio sp. TaxID=1917215 RepID=UPI0025BE57E0|nr:hypothetical protein [Ferrovibrio sp.]MBX3454912.1 hypothetical protein [Ferrovibrio sp.]